MPKFDLSEVAAAKDNVLEATAAEYAAEEVSRALAGQGVAEAMEARQYLDRVRDEIASVRSSIFKKSLEMGRTPEKARSEAAAAAKKLEERLATNYKEAQDCVAQNRDHADPIVRKAVWKALIERELGKAIEMPAQLEELLTEMVADNLLTVNETGIPLKVYGRQYAVPSSVLLEETDISAIQELADNLVKRVRDKIKDLATLDPLNLPLPRATGTCVLYVPPERVNGDPKKWRPGGTITLQASGGIIRPVDASGRIEAGVREAIELGVKLPSAWLNETTPPFVKGDDFDKNRKAQLIWHLIVRGLRSAKWFAEISATPGLISPEEFFMEGKPGLCLVDHGRAWEWEENGEKLWIPRPVLLVERKVVGEDKFLKILDLPAYLVDFFSECRNEYPEGEKFSGLPMRLGALMRARFREIREEAVKRGKYVPPTPPASVS